MLTTRRQAIKTLTAAAIASTALGRFSVAADAPAAPPAAAAPTGPYKLPALPYGYDALEPHIDADTMRLHHDKHHKAYVTKLNEALAKEPTFTPPADVDDLVAHLDTVPESIRTAVRNQGGGHANHSLFWQTLAPEAKMDEPDASHSITKAISDDIGGFDKLKDSMSEEGAKLFGSGWVWLVLDGGKKLTILTSPNQDSPLTDGHYPLFGIDVWEHAYYLKYQNRRPEYVKAFWNVINWDYAAEQYAAASKS